MRKSLIAHFAWEVLLLILATIAVVLALVQTDFRLAVGFWMNLASLGLLASGFAASMRLSGGNIAVGALAALAGITFARLVHSGWAVPVAGLAVAALTALIGIILGVIAGLTKAPGWVVSLIPFALLPPILSDRTRPIIIPVADLERATSFDAFVWLAVFVIVSLAGGCLLLVPGLRNFMGTHKFLAALAGFTLSSVLAGLSGIVWTMGLSAAPTSADTGRVLLAIGAVLLGGVSVFGGRGGVAGTVLGVALLAFLNIALTRMGAPAWVGSGIVPAAAILIGIVLSRIGDGIGDQATHPRPDDGSAMSLANRLYQP